MRSAELENNLSEIRDRIAQTCRRCGRSVEDVTLVAVSKFFPVTDIEALYDVGQRDFGENYVQEWQEKRDGLPDDIRWHFIGALQSNKAKDLVGKVALIHGVDRASVLQAISRRARDTQDILIQVNTGHDSAKGGVDPTEVAQFFERAQELARVRVRGLMTIPPFDAKEAELRGYFAQMRELFQALQAKSGDIDVLSMGMTSDFEWAIEEGATMVRLGTAIFGSRKTP